MAIDQITESAFSILNELRDTKFTRRQLEILQKLFQSLVDKTGEILSHKNAEEKEGES